MEQPTLISKSLEAIQMDVSVKRQGDLTYLYVDNWHDGCPAMSVFKNAPYVDIHMSLPQLYQILDDYKVFEGWIYEGAGPLNIWGKQEHAGIARDWIKSLGYAVTEDSRRIEHRPQYNL